MSAKHVFITTAPINGELNVICFVVGMMHIVVETVHNHEFILANVDFLSSYASYCSVEMSEVGENPDEYADSIYKHHEKMVNLVGDGAVIEAVRMINMLKREGYEFVMWGNYGIW